jgi:hypothetical protein
MFDFAVHLGEGVLCFLLRVDRIAIQASDDKGFNENRAA